jgi:hypothetical protein
LQESFAVAGRFAPNVFENFMRFKELSGVKKFDAALEGCAVEVH